MIRDVTVLFWVQATLVALVAGVGQGFTGFGFAVIFTPVFALLVGRPQEVIVLSLVIGTVLSLGVLVETRCALDVRRTWPLIISAMLAAPLGVWLLAKIDTHALKVLIGICATGTAVLWMIRQPAPLRWERGTLAIAGLLGGFLNGSTSMGGPPPALAIWVQRFPVQQGRAALTTFNLVSCLIGIVIAVPAGVVSFGFMLHGLWLLPSAMAGSLLGGVMVRRVSYVAFRRVLAVMVLLAGLFGSLSILVR